MRDGKDATAAHPVVSQPASENMTHRGIRAMQGIASEAPQPAPAVEAVPPTQQATPPTTESQPKTGPMTLEEKALKPTASEILGPRGIAAMQGKS